MSPKGDSCFPSIATLADDTGLSERSIITHLQEADALGWIARQAMPMPSKGKGWKRMAYVATAPAKVMQLAQKVVKDVHHEQTEGGEPDDEGGEPDGDMVVKDVHPMHPVDASSDAASPPRPKSSIQEKAAKLLDSGRATAWEEKFLRSQLSKLAAGKPLSVDKLIEVLDEHGEIREAKSVNVPSVADQERQMRETLKHDEGLLKERTADDGHIPPDIVAACIRKRNRLALVVPPWLSEMSEKHPVEQTEPRRRKLTSREVDSRLGKIAKAADDAEKDSASQSVG
ncbi:hypothetical protein LCGC14_0273980 [marine sediment metagenome]